MRTLTAQMMPLYYAKKFVKFGPVTPELTELICEHQVRHGQKNWHISSNISRYTGPIFATFSPYESALRANDGSYLIFQFVKGRCHGNQIFCRNEGKLILRAFYAVGQMVAWFCFATTCSGATLWRRAVY